MYLILNDNLYLSQIIDSLMLALIYNNIECKIVSEVNLNDDNTYILLNVNNIKILPKNFFIYNFEQLITDRKWSNDFFNKLTKAKKVLDYSIENVKYLKSKGINAIHLPFGWTPIFENNKEIINKKNNLIFLGSKNSRRDNILKDYDIIYENKVFGESFKNLINESKFSFNIHFYDGKTILELTRIIPLISDYVQVISERSDDKYYDDIFEGIVDFVNFNDHNEVKNKLKNYNFEKCIKNKKNLIKRLNFMEIIKNNKNLF